MGAKSYELNLSENVRRSPEYKRHNDVNQHRSLKAALKAVNGIGDDGDDFVLCLGKRQHRGELFSLTARRRFDEFIRIDHLQTLARAIID